MTEAAGEATGGVAAPFWVDPEEPGLVTPEPGAPDLVVLVGLAVLWAFLGILHMSPVDRGRLLLWSEPVGGGIALAVGTLGVFFWWRRRQVPALARECQSWAALGVALLVSYAVGWFAPEPSPGLPATAWLAGASGHLLLMLLSLVAFAVSFAQGYRVTPLVAWGRFGSLAAFGFAVWDGWNRTYWQHLLG